MPRLEYKYYLPVDYIDDFRRDILPFLNYDKYMLGLPKKEYTVRSIYMDSPCLITFCEKESGLVIRNKYRIRGYNFQSDDSIVFLEIKRKKVDYVSKNRAKLYYRDLNKFLETKDFSLLHKCGNSDCAISDARNFLFHFRQPVPPPLAAHLHLT